jgi:hypothetical protein
VVETLADGVSFDDLITHLERLKDGEEDIKVGGGGPSYGIRHVNAKNKKTTRAETGDGKSQTQTAKQEKEMAFCCLWGIDRWATRKWRGVK